jgi:hypothetical protein
MLNRVAMFIGWGLSSLLFLVGVTNIASQPTMAIVMLIWGLLAFPPLWKATAKFGRTQNIIARLVMFLFSPILTFGNVYPSQQSVVNSTDSRDSITPKVPEVNAKKNESTRREVDVPSQVVDQGSNRKSSVTAPVIPSPKPSPVAENGVTMTSFKRIKLNMSYAEVVEILGKEGEEMSSGGAGGITTIMYKWDGGFMVGVTAMFQDDKLINKSQVGLR